MKSRYLLGLLGLLALASAFAIRSADLSAQEPPPPVVSVSTEAQTNEQGVVTDPEVTVEVEVTGFDENDETWRDLHLKAVGGAFPKRNSSTGTNITVSDTNSAEEQTWETKNNNTQFIDVYADGEDGFGNGTYTFTLNFDFGGKEFKSKLMDWVATTDGNKGRSTGVIDEQGPEAAPNGPQVAIAANGDAPISVSVNATTSIPMHTEPQFVGEDYEVFTSLSLNPTYEDARSIGINSDTDPVPVTTWGLQFFDFESSIDASGEADPSPAIQVPNDSNLIGEEFYLVFAVMNGTEVVIASAPIKVTISAAGGG